MAFVIADVFHDVERYRLVEIERREVHDVIYAMRRNVIKEFVRRAAVRVDECQTLAILNILNSHVLEEGRFAHARLANHVHVTAAVFRLDAERRALAARVSGGEIGYSVRILHGVTIILLSS